MQVPDSDAPTCQICRTQFTLLNRRVIYTYYLNSPHFLQKNLHFFSRNILIFLLIIIAAPLSKVWKRSLWFMFQGTPSSPLSVQKATPRLRPMCRNIDRKERQCQQSVSKRLFRRGRFWRWGRKPLMELGPTTILSWKS